MLLLLVLTTYIIAINVYSVILIHSQRQESLAMEGAQISDIDKPTLKRSKRTKDLSLIFSAILGGALGTYVYMLATKYRLKNMWLMVGLPVIVALNTYLVILLFNTYVFI